MRGLLLVALVSGCIPTALRREGARPLPAHAVDWNPQKVDVGRVQALAETGDELVLFGDKGAFVLVAGALVATDPSVKSWRAAGTLPAPDGNGTWIVGVDGQGLLHHVRARTKLEPISARFGLEQTPLFGLARVDERRHAFLLGGGFAVADGGKLTRFEAPLRGIAAGSGTLAELLDGGLRVTRVSGDRSYTLPGARGIGVDSLGATWVADERAVYREAEPGSLKLAYVAARVDAFATAGPAVWLSDAGALMRLGDGAAPADTGAQVPPSAKLVGADNGDVWVLDATLTRLSVAIPSVTWPSGVHARVCSKCHDKGGAAGVDLGNEAAWQGKRALIRQRVIEKGDMPPKSTPLAAEDRAAIEAWTRP